MSKYHDDPYKRESLRAEMHFFADTNISQANKDLVKRFLPAYDVGHARKAMFFKQVKIFLKEFNDVSRFLDKNLDNDSRETAKDEINKFFFTLRSKISSSYYNTIVPFSNRLMKWLNGGVKPYAFRDIKGSKKDMKRKDLKPESMITLEDRDQLIKACIDSQEKAIITLQLDGGFRPSEFVNLKVGDFTNHGGGLGNIRVENGKTGSRDCPIQRSLPHVLNWLEQHPTKNPQDFLFVQQSRQKGKPYKAEGMRKLIRRIFARTNINKPDDMYALRHSSCYQDKLDGITAELSSARHGHSIEHWEKTYARMDAGDRVAQMRNQIADKPSMKSMSMECPTCGQINSAEQKLCTRCHNPLTLAEALKYKEKADNYELMNQRLSILEELLVKSLEGKTRDEQKKTILSIVKN